MRLFCALKFNYHPIRFTTNPEQNYIIISNHTGALDPIFLSLSFDRPVFFLASEHIFRNPWVRKILRFMVAPIPFSKTSLDLSSLREIKTIADHGHTLSFFPSGNRSVSGPEEPIPRATSKLLKLLNTPVLFYRIEGGYLSSPRWAKSPRRGRMSGEVVLHLSAEEIREISHKELDQMLYKFLDANPYSSSRNHNIAYKNRNRAEYLERILWLCPHCGEVGTLYSQKHDLHCECGFGLHYGENGRFEPLSPNKTHEHWAEIFPHVDAIYQWQATEIKKRYTSEYLETLQPDEALFCDEHETLHRITRAQAKDPMLSGTLSLYKDRIEVRDSNSGMAFVLPIANIMNTSCIGPQLLQIAEKTANQIYEFQNIKPRSAYKYIQLITHIQSLT